MDILEIKQNILSLIELQEAKYSHHITSPSKFWKDVLQKLSFIFDFSEANLRNIRLHTGFGFYLGSSWSTCYYEAQEISRGIKEIDSSRFIKDYKKLTENVPVAFHCSELDYNNESISIHYGDKYITEDILRAQSTVSNLFQIRDTFSSCLEIGAGYGSLANQLLKLFHVKKYFIVDFPETLYWSILWTGLVSPEKKILLFNGNNNNEIEDADVIFIPPFLIDNLKLEVDLAINENSFCEMTQEQVDFYLDNNNIKFNVLYSNNRDRQFMNNELQSLNSALSKRYILTPSTDFYDKIYQKEYSKHNCKYIYFCSKNISLEMIDPSKLCGLSIRKEH
ncbi:MAG: putative sugar O-methyltransferase [Proteobacteria bacterium]|nr:putative sugar O-methyltransferase [Pseudomonadota bacterium]